MLGIDSIRPETLAKLYDFVAQGGRVFCIEKFLTNRSASKITKRTMQPYRSGSAN